MNTTYHVRIDSLDWECELEARSIGAVGEKAIREFRRAHPDEVAEFDEDLKLEITVTHTVSYSLRVFPLEELAHRKDVHTEHCCSECGCKYNDHDCTVATGKKKPSFEHKNTSICYDWNW
jgi:hypothetical protein